MCVCSSVVIDLLLLLSFFFCCCFYTDRVYTFLFAKFNPGLGSTLSDFKTKPPAKWKKMRKLLEGRWQTKRRGHPSAPPSNLLKHCGEITPKSTCICRNTVSLYAIINLKLRLEDIKKRLFVQPSTNFDKASNWQTMPSSTARKP